MCMQWNTGFHVCIAVAIMWFICVQISGMFCARCYVHFVYSMRVNILRILSYFIRFIKGLNLSIQEATLSRHLC